MRAYTYRDKVFMYDPEILRVIQFNQQVDVLKEVRAGIDRLIESGTVFKRVSATFYEDDNGDNFRIEVKPV